MKLFFKYTLISVLFLFVSLIGLDTFYTHIYNNNNVRSKVQYLKSFENKKVDYIFLGSSRVENGLNPKIIDSITNKTSINMGIQGARLKDIFLLIKLIEEYKIETKEIFVQLDYIYNMQDAKSAFLTYQLIPFKDEKNVLDYLNNSSEDNIYHKIPFFRYSRSDQKLGVRELFANIIGKSSGIVDNKGFEPLYTTNLNSSYKLPNYITTNDSLFKSMIKYIEKNNLKVSFFCSPLRLDTHNMDYIKKLKTKFPEFLDLSMSITNKELFKDNLHLNNDGATEFSILFSKSILKN